MALVTLARFASLPEAMVAKSLLEAEGIAVFMPEQGLVAGYLDNAVMGGWRLLVVEDDAQAAKALLHQLTEPDGQAPNKTPRG